jgi:hypothetical protein
MTSAGALAVPRQSGVLCRRSLTRSPGPSYDYDDVLGTQFLSRDPAVAVTREPYGYGNENPLNRADPAGWMTGGPTLRDPGPAISGSIITTMPVTSGLKAIRKAITASRSAQSTAR